MNFLALQENLRRELRKRIEAGELTGLELARRTSFTQAHISNFLNRKRGLKLSALDRVLRAIGLSLYDLLDPLELVRFAAVPSSSSAEFAEAPLVSAETAANREVIVNEEVQQLVRFRRSFLNRLRPDPASPARTSWTRFVLIEANPRDAASMWPRLAPGAAVLLDRHYTSLAPYRRNDRNLYAVRAAVGLALRYVELGGAVLVLRPHHPDSPIEVLPPEPGRAPTDRIIGRAAHIALEV